MNKDMKNLIPLLKGSENYPIWSIRMEAGLIRERLSAPLTDESHLKNKEALALIGLHSADGPLLQIKHCNTALSAWNTYKKLYNNTGFSSNFLYIKELFNTSLENYNSMEEYLNKIKELYEELNSREIIIPEIVIITWILNNLNESYESYITNITQSLRNNSNSYNLESLSSSLLDEARRNSNYNNTT